MRVFASCVQRLYPPYDNFAFISGGENISSIEVETALHQHEAVLHVAVVAVPDSYWGEIPVAVVEAKPGAQVQEGIDATFDDRLVNKINIDMIL